MLKEIFRIRLVLPRFIVTYDADIVLRFLQTLPPWKEILLKWLSLKTVILIVLLPGHRRQSINSLSLSLCVSLCLPLCLSISLSVCLSICLSVCPCLCLSLSVSLSLCLSPSLSLSLYLSQAFHLKPIELNEWEPDKIIWPVRTVVEYIKASEQYGKSQKLISRYYKYMTLTTQMVCSNVRQTLKVAGISTAVFSAYSTRHSTSSETFMRGGTLKDIMKNGDGKHHHRLLEFIISESGNNLTIKLTEVQVDWNYSYILWDKLLRYNKCPPQLHSQKICFQKRSGKRCQISIITPE